MKLLFLQTQDYTFYSHRLPFARAARDAGFEVVVAAHEDAHGALIRAEGLRLVPLPWKRSGLNPFYEVLLLLKVIRLYAEERPDVVHQVTAKPILYGTLAAALTGGPAIVNTFTGLGFMFISQSLKARVLRVGTSLALRLALAYPRSRTIFQNGDDLALFTDGGLIAPEKAELIRGSGVDTALYAPSPEPEGTPLVVLPARMLWDKGVGEFVEAARSLKGLARFALVGEGDDHNPAAVPAAVLAEWKVEGAVECWGLRTDMAAVYAAASVVCLPSYREGLPKALMEAAACARALVTTDVPGCREVVRHEETGLLVPARDAGALAGALRRLLSDAALRRALGAKARALAVEAFAEEKVTGRTLAVYGGLLDS